MFGNRIDDDFANNIKGASAAIDSPGLWRLLMLVALGIGAFFAWAATHEIEETARALGRVIPSQQIQLVQSLEGGIVRALNVAEGDMVEVGDILIVIDDTRFGAERGELSERDAALRAELTRLQAEIAFADTIVFDGTLKARTPLIVEAERQLFFSRRDQLARETQVLDDQLTQRRSELAELLALRHRTREIIAPLTEESDMTEDMVIRNLVPKLELLRLKSRLAELNGDLSVSAASQVRLQASVREAENQIAAARSSYVLSARQRLAKLQQELAVIGEALRAADDRLARTQLRAPVRGTVNRLSVQTLGAVVQPGASLVEIVPADDSLLIEANLDPRDIAFVKLGEHASVKISAYDYVRYGALDGEVVRIGADTIQSADGTELFQVIIRTDRAWLGTEDAPLPITPGMVASVDIQTGEKTVLTYLSKPILRARSEALRER